MYITLYERELLLETIKAVIIAEWHESIYFLCMSQVYLSMYITLFVRELLLLETTEVLISAE